MNMYNHRDTPSFTDKLHNAFQTFGLPITVLAVSPFLAIVILNLGYFLINVLNLSNPNENHRWFDLIVLLLGVGAGALVGPVLCVKKHRNLDLRDQAYYSELLFRYEMERERYYNRFSKVQSLFSRVPSLLNYFIFYSAVAIFIYILQINIDDFHNYHYAEPMGLICIGSAFGCFVGYYCCETYILFTKWNLKKKKEKEEKKVRD